MELVEILLEALMIVLAKHWEILVGAEILLAKGLYLVEVSEKTVGDLVVEGRILEEVLEVEI